jgi:hypothetical protein
VHPLCARLLPRLRPRLAGEGGFTLVEMVSAIALLLVGVLGTATMIEGAGRTTRDNKAREGATSLSRELVDATRAIPYAELTASGIGAALQARPALADSDPGGAWTISRGGVTYTISATACAIDDAKDGRGPHDVAVAFCADSSETGTRDRNADDYRRVTIAVEWRRGGVAERNRQTALLTNPAGGLGPTVSELKLTAPLVANPTSPTIADAGATEAEFSVKLTNSAASVTWSVDGDVQGPATGSGTAWSATWDLAGWEDGAYTVQAQGFDDDGRSGAARKIAVVVNRHPPPAPAGFDGGRNGNGAHVDLEWLASPEGDVVGYRVYRTDAGGTPIARACPPSAAGASAYVTQTDCVDEDAPAAGPVRYAAVAVDVAPDGALREGTPTPVKEIVEGNTVPTAPVDLVTCAGGTAGCLLPDGSAAPVGTTVLTWAASLDLDLGDAVRFYRVYRDGTAYANRYGRVYGQLALAYVDTAPGGSSHSYRVTAVDERFGESAKSLQVIG